MTITVKSESLGWLAPAPRLPWSNALRRLRPREPQPSVGTARGVGAARIVRTFALLLLIAAPMWFHPAHAQSPALLDMVTYNGGRPLTCHA